jgi:hypothetical protein
MEAILSQCATRFEKHPEINNILVTGAAGFMSVIVFPPAIICNAKSADIE